ncbi:hemin-degrading factor [Chelativorans sp. YIM 93263]|uniref:hemin-degrading factor n=1 Tax=Chelativorans sp. YIM 93263 TaxID=2906648 RepID=UPI0023788085|nr:ChuX/HutX family heme-like substrate-binding protein [Chelativorans sp. YIM 93263]
MTGEMAVSPEGIRKKRADNPKMRERDLARTLGISEAELIAAHCGVSATRIEPRVPEFLNGMEAVGSVMALTRNESAVHEKIGVYENASASERNAIVLGKDIDLRIFPKQWAHAFAVEKRVEDTTRHSLQFFDEAGDAVHKVHLRPESNFEAYRALVDKLISPNQEPGITVQPISTDGKAEEADGSVSEVLRERWSKMQDVHQFVGILRTLNLTRRQAVHLVGEEFAWPLDGVSVPVMFERAAEQETPIMCFVGNRGCIQIHSGPVANVKPLGPWLNVMDPTFHLHLRLDHLMELWAVRKPVKEGHVTSLEAYDANGRMVIQFFGKRHEGQDELADWRTLMEDLPRIARSSAA